MSLHHRLRTAAGSPSDPYWSNTSLLLLGNGTNGGQNNTFIDSSSNNFTVTRYGNVTQGSFSPFTIATGSEYSTGTNGGSGYFDGNGDYVSLASNAAFAFGSSNDLTIEMWYYPQSRIDLYPALFSFNGMFAANVHQFFDRHDNNNTKFTYFVYNYSTSSPLLTSTTSISNGQWYHLAITRSGSTWRLFVNGTIEQTVTWSSAVDGGSSSSLAIGAIPGQTDADLNGFISSLRILKGTAQYTANFTPSTTPLSSITNTSLLLNFTNAAIIDSTGKNDIETVGDAQISTSVKKYGTGSLKFDGTGDYLTIPKSSLLDFGTGDFTIEAWINPTAASGTIIDTRTQDTLDAYIFNILGASGKLDFVYSSSRVTSSGAISTSVWTHVAVVRSSGTIKLYINGTEDGSASYSSAINAQAFASIGGGRSTSSTSVNGYYFNGYIDDLRITKGVARYTAAFTPSTRQLPAR